MTYPHIGNVGINEYDNESSCIQVKGLVVRDISTIVSNFRHTSSLLDFLKIQNIVGISDIDTRALTRLIREKGVQHGCIISSRKENVFNISLALRRTRKFSRLHKKLNIVNKVTTSYPYIWTQGTGSIKLQLFTNFSNLLYRVVVYDFGVKRNILRILVDYGCSLIVVPSSTSIQEVIDMKPDGIFLSNGPGDPNLCDYAISAIRFVLSKTNIPLFGICLGHQLLALACGAKTIKMKFGHHGSNHPVKDLLTNRIIITTQNHNFVVDSVTLPDILRKTHISLFDGTLQGIHHISKPAFGFQGHPEASPGPHDSITIFNYFILLIKHYRCQKNKNL